MADQQKEGAVSAGPDALAQAVQAAMTRIAEMAPKVGLTLIDSISASDWAEWDASGEKALVTDPVGVDGVDFLEQDDLADAA